MHTNTKVVTTANSPALERSREAALDTATRETLREAIRINAAEMDRLRKALLERENRANQLKLAADAIDEAIEKEAAAANLQTAVPDKFASRQRERRNSLAWAARREAYIVLKRMGRPMSRRELFEELKRAGLKFNSRDPLQSITKIMSEAKEFLSTGDGYWFRDEPNPEK